MNGRRPVAFLSAALFIGSLLGTEASTTPVHPAQRACRVAEEVADAARDALRHSRIFVGNKERALGRVRAAEQIIARLRGWRKYRAEGTPIEDAPPPGRPKEGSRTPPGA